MNYVLDMDTQDEQGITKRDQLLQVIQSTPADSAPHQNAVATLDNEPEIPEAIEHVWDWFWELHRTRGSGMGGPEPITYLEIQAWNNLTENNIRDIEVEFLKLMDRLYLNFVNKKKPKPGAKK
jgi:hypothetical protein